MGILIAAGLLLACLALATLPRRDVPGRGLALLRCFFPSWRFFEQIEPGPSLQVCTAAPHERTFGPWRDAWTARPRAAATLLVNARGNLELAYQSLVEQLWSEVEDASGDPSASLTYQLVRQLVEVECLRPLEAGPGCRYRFRLTLLSSDQRDGNATGGADPHAGAASGETARGDGDPSRLEFVSAQHELGSR